MKMTQNDPIGYLASHGMCGTPQACPEIHDQRNRGPESATECY